MKQFDIEDRWPELFAQLDATQRNAVRQSLAAAWHEGFEPTREDVENLTDRAYWSGMFGDGYAMPSAPRTLRLIHARSSAEAPAW